MREKQERSTIYCLTLHFTTTHLPKPSTDIFYVSAQMPGHVADVRRGRLGKTTSS